MLSTCARDSVAADMSSEEGAPVDLYLYDLSNGFASLLSPAILGRQIEGVWHTSVVVYDREYFYGGGGITSCAPGSTQLGAPLGVQRLGRTQVPAALVREYLQGLAAGPYAAAAYRLLEHNCNHFSDELAQFLCGARVPKHVLLQPDLALSAPQRAALQALLDGLAPPTAQPVSAFGARANRQDSPEYLTLNDQVEEARRQSQQLEQCRSTLAEKLARKERRKDKRRKKERALHTPVADMSEAVETAPVAALACAGPSSRPEPDQPDQPDQPDPRLEAELRRRARDPPIVYKDIDGSAEFEKLVAALGSEALGADELQSLDELRQYLVLGEGSWVLGDEWLAFFGRLLGAAEPVRAAGLRCLAAAALREDVALLLHQDRRHHALLNHAHAVDTLPLPEQRALALFMCNLFENLSSSEWLLYISEWEHNGQPLSNIRATTKVCVHCTLAEDEELREYGTALMYNIATKEVKTVVFDEVCVELAMALLQLLQAAPGEEHLFRATRALARLAQHSQDVPQLVAMVGPDPAAFRGTSARVDEQIELIMQKVK